MCLKGYKLSEYCFALRTNEADALSRIQISVRALLQANAVDGFWLFVGAPVDTATPASGAGTHLIDMPFTEGHAWRQV